MWYALLLLVSVEQGVSMYTVDSIYASEAECVEVLVAEHRSEGMCAPVEVQFPQLEAGS